MGERIRNPPLLEAICEFRFDSPGWDWTIPGRLFDRIQDQFPIRSQVNAPTFELKMAPTASASAKAVGAPERIQLKTGDESAMVQVGRDLLAVNQLKPYPGWDAFSTMIMNVYSEYVGLLPKYDIRRIGLRYINRLPVSERFKIGDYLVIDPPLPESLNRPLNSFFQRYELNFDNPRGILIHQTGTQTIENSKFAMLDLDFVSTPQQDFGEPEAIAPWIGGAHDRIFDAFVASLNPKLFAKLNSEEK
ncbi:MAG: TIGR04255 family protein [Candidatus Lambdaproteobacteria bacterium]|nr:TIGR04255 family protein [Candidatus Lambdaproteobacteria bacterium]